MSNLTDSSLDMIAAQIAKKGSFIIAAHVSPDSDAIGASVGLARGLNSLGKKVSVYLPLEVSAKTSRLFEGVEIVSELPKEKVDVVIAVDTANEERIIGQEERQFLSCGHTSVNIDHHISNELYADYNFVDSLAPSSTVIIYRLLMILGATIDVSTAELLFSGLSGDTGSFRFSNASAEAFTVAGELVQLGARPDKISDMLYFSDPLRAIRLRAYALGNIEVFLSGKLALLAITQSVLAKYEASAEDTEGLVDEVRRLDGILLAVFIREGNDGFWKVSLRAKDSSVDVNKIAGKFGGGGHRAAAGCKLSGSLEEVKKQLLAGIKESVKIAAAI